MFGFLSLIWYLVGLSGGWGTPNEMRVVSIRIVHFLDLILQLERW